jgi:proteasome lid subunit RPN8/RPN11
MEGHTSMTNDPLEISAAGIRETIRLLREAHDRECVLLWLGRRESGVQRVVEVYRPIQKASLDYFEIPRDSMKELMDHLRQRGLYVASQVHTHPEKAFHSLADDRWAIVRHRGALSVVLPWFATTTTPDNFLATGAVYQLSPSNNWDRIEGAALRSAMRIVP